MRPQLKGADLYCGAGGSSKGLIDACAAAGADMELIAINHWDIAIKTHSRNHPGAKHLCTSLDAVDPKKLVPGGRLDILIASPECIHFSIARGGRPMSDQSRSSAWQILRWAEALYIDNILIENVREFLDWCPLGADGRPLKSKKGETFKAFIAALRSLGYKVEWRVLNAADYGDPTTRERLFIMAKRGNRRITWPVPTHAARTKQTSLFAQHKPWRTAREIIDWSVRGKSIFTRKKPLAPATLARIAAGLKKFGGKNAEPFLVILRGNQDVRSIDQPTPTVTTSGAHLGVCEPFVLQQQSGGAPRSVDNPLPTVATDGAIALIEPFLVGAGGPVYSGKPKSVNEPMNTVLTENHLGLVQPFMIPFFGERDGQDPRVHSIDEPLPTVTGHGAGALVQPFLMTMEHGGRLLNADDPMPTITSGDGFGLVEPFILPQFGESTPRSIDRPLGVVTTTSRGVGLVEPFITSYYGTENVSPVDDPLPTATTKDRFGLVECDGIRLDILFRMLQPRELARAQGFPDDYVFEGTREQIVRQIGNAVPRRLARALCAEMLGFTEALERSA